MEGWRLGGWETNKERRRRKPADGALVSEGFSSETDPAAVKKTKCPAGRRVRRGLWGLDESAV